MEKQSKGLTALFILMGLIFIIVGLGNMFIFRAGYYQDLLVTNFIPVALTMFLSVVIIILGVFMVVSSVEVSTKICEFIFKGRSSSEIYSINLGATLVIFGILGLFYFTGLRYSVQRLVLQITTLLLLYAGFLLIRFNVWVADWVEEKISNHRRRRVERQELKKVLREIDERFEKYKEREK